MKIHDDDDEMEMLNIGMDEEGESQHDGLLNAFMKSSTPIQAMREDDNQDEIINSVVPTSTKNVSLLDAVNAVDDDAFMDMENVNENVNVNDNDNDNEHVMETIDNQSTNTRVLLNPDDTGKYDNL